MQFIKPLEAAKPTRSTGVRSGVLCGDQYSQVLSLINVFLLLRCYIYVYCLASTYKSTLRLHYVRFIFA